MTPEFVGRYRIVREIARGGMGVVYEGVDPQLGRRVAVKVVLAGGDLERFLVEVRAVSRLSHPGIVSLFDAGQVDAYPYLVMELVDGEALDQRLKRTGPLDPREAVAIVRDVARAVEAAHASGVLHRDLKPANVLLARDGRALLTDFGVARDAETERQRLTHTGQMLGTPSFMSPEQADGDKAAIGVGSDVYGLGATLFALVTGLAPFRGATALKIVSAVLSKPAPTLRETRSELVDARLEAIVGRCLCKDPAGRYESAAALAAALDDYLEPRREPVARRSKAGVVAALTIVALGVGVAAGVWVAQSPPEESAAVSPPTPPEGATPLPKLPATGPFQRTWVQRGPAALSPPARYNLGQSLLYSRALERTILVGGFLRAPRGPLGDTWTWDGATWAPLALTGRQEPSYGHSLVELGSDVLVLAGNASATVHPHTKARLISGGGWEELPGEPPPQRWDGCAVATADAVYQFGGRASGEVVLNDLWVLRAGRWAQLRGEPSAPWPSPRTLAAGAWDSERDVLVFYGGEEADGDVVSDPHWEFDLQAGTWSEPQSGGRTPGRRSRVAMVGTGPHGVLLFGGRADGVTPVGTWWWNGSVWREEQAPTRPPPRERHGLAWDTKRELAVLYGGLEARSNGVNEAVADTWELVPLERAPKTQSELTGTWARVESDDGPKPRTGHERALVYDGRGACWVFAGHDPNKRRSLVFSDLWSWNGDAWTSRPQLGNWPAPRSSHAVAYDTDTKRLFVFGGAHASNPLKTTADFWEWDGLRWTAIDARGPERRGWHTLTYDPQRRRLVLIGGFDSSSGRAKVFGDVWEWDGGSWEQAFTASPSGAAAPWTSTSPERHTHAAAYDPLLKQVVVFGGWNGDARVWAWDGGSWTAYPAGGPVARYGPSLVASPEGLLLFGGMGPVGRGHTPELLNDLWAWRGGVFQEVHVPGERPKGRVFAAAAWDSRRARLVLFGGERGRQTLGALWELSLSR